jgi:hypothetical protein
LFRSAAAVVAVLSGAVGAVAVAPVSPALAETAPASVVAVAAGDIACDAADANFSGANTSTCQMQATANRVVALKPSYVLPLGDEQYVNTSTQGTQPTPAQFRSGYGQSWGQLAARLPGVKVRPVAGNHEYGDLAETGQSPLGDGAGYYSYFGPNGQNALPSTVTGASTAWYSYDIPVATTSWHVVALDGECFALPRGSGSSGCDFGSAQESWLVGDLAAHRGQCILAYVHEPRWAWSDDDPRYAALWADLVNGGATAVLAGHDHGYERFAPMDVNGNPSAYGASEFIVGTGGRSLETIDRSTAKPAALRAADDTHFGVLRLTLKASSADFAFQSSSGSNLDSGTLSCTQPAPTTAPAVTDVTPVSGPSAGGTTFAVTGSGFTTSGTTVTVAGTAATGVHVTSSTSLTAVAPAGVTTGDVAVTTSGGTSPPTAADQFTNTFATNGYAVSLTASSTTPDTGSAVTLTATANQDIGPTPYFVSIIDTTTGAPVAIAAKGQVATATITQKQATTRRYVAQVDSRGRAPVMAAAAPKIVRWSTPSPNAPTVSSVTPATGPGAGGTTVTVAGSGFVAGTTVAFGGVAASAVNITSPTQLTAVAPVRNSNAGAVVDVTVTTSAGTSAASTRDRFSYAFSSNGFTASLTATTTSPAVGGATTLEATANQDLGPTPYWLSIVDVATGAVVAHTGWGTSVNVTLTRDQAQTGRYLAEVDKGGGVPVQAASSPVQVIWSGAPSGALPSVTSVSPPSGPSSGWSVVTVSGSGFAPNAWAVFGGTSALAVTVNSTSSLTATVPTGTATVHAVIAQANGSSATSVNDEYTYTQSQNGYSISLSADHTAAPVGGSVVLTATANQDLGPTPYTFSIVDATTGAIVAHSGSGSVLTVTVSSAAAATRRFVAQVDDMGAPPLQAVSEPQIVTWS